MKVLVYVAGAVGSYLGAMLANHGHDVTLVVRPQTAQTIDGGNLRLSTPGNPDSHAQVRLVTSVRQAFLEDAYDLIMLAMKSYDVAEALDSLIAFAPTPFPRLMTLQNGIGIEEMVLNEIRDVELIAASLTTPVRRQTPAHIVVERGDRGLALAPTRKRQNVRPWVEMFNEAGVTCVRIGNHRSMKWSKALLNMLGNASSAIINRHPRAIYDYGPTYRLEMEMLQEALNVMQRLKLKVVDLPGTPATRLAFAVRRLPDSLVKPILTRIVAGGRGNKMPSFHMDLSAGRKKSEVIYHNGAVAAAGEELGIATPVNAALSNTLIKMAQGEIDWQVFDGNPARLIEEVKKYR